jgi:hypothetical protein
MSFVNFQELDSRISKSFGNVNESLLKSFKNEFQEETRLFSDTDEYDIFLSHRYLDAARIRALKDKLEDDYGYSVYVDWIEDTQLSRDNITKETAQQIRKRMSNCKSLILAYSDNSSESLWIPWEMGYFDGLKRLVSIMPIVERPTSYNDYQYIGQEYLGIYSYITEEHDTNQEMQLWVNDEVPECYIAYNDWMKGRKPRFRD